MSDDWREELVQKMARHIAVSDDTTPDPNSEWCDQNWHCWIPEARAALVAAEPVIREQVEFELRIKNVCFHATSHPEIYKTAEDDLCEENVKLRAALKRMLLEFDFMVECGVIPDVRNDVIFEDAAAALKETGDE